MDEAEFEPCDGGIWGKIHVEATSRSNFKMQNCNFKWITTFYNLIYTFSISYKLPFIWLIIVGVYVGILP